MARRATLIKQVRQASENPVLVLDAGNTLFGQWIALQSQGKAMNAMGYDAMTVGYLDLTGGIDTLKQRAEEADFPILSCNLADADERSILPPYTILERDGLRFGIIGVTEPDAARELAKRNIAIQVLEPLETVRRYLAEVKGRVDLVIVLSHLGLDQDKALAQAVPGIDVIVGGRSRTLMRQPERVGQTVIVQMGYDGEWLGRLDLTFRKAAEPVVKSAQLEILFMRPEVPDAPDLAELVADYKQRFPEPTPKAP
ncbi:MAG: metallophosphatase [Chloroflexi bacterium]|nr:metallophosphatase [Chloroflexota bacterium]